ncbi:MAG: radical SAM protein, partial [Vicinamibacteria bacterium]
MSRRLRERHEDLLRAEIPVGAVSRAGEFRIALCYPNLYYVGMSNLGFQGVFQMFANTPGVVCERAFLPDDVDAEDLARGGTRLVSFESGLDLGRFDVVAFSVSFENDYVHVLKMLRMAGIPLRAADRGKNDPLVVMGGAALFLNPEPLAPFADVIAVGEGEALVPRLLEAIVGPDPRAQLDTLTAKEGFYVPSRYQVAYHEDGTVARSDGPGPVIRQRGWPGKMPLPQTVILTPNTEMSMKFMVEISRG